MWHLQQNCLNGYMVADLSCQQQHPIDDKQQQQQHSLFKWLTGC
jgi:hypothetical protein